MPQIQGRRDRLTAAEDKKTTTVKAFESRDFKEQGKLNTSHRYNLLPLLPSGPGGIQRELVVYDLPVAKVIIFS